MRRDLESMLALADRLDAAGERGVLATLLSTHGSSYRPLGSMMLAGPPGTPRAGGVSGGCLEEYIARHGRDLLVNRDAALLGFDTSADGTPQAARPTLGCGGHVDVLVERFTPTHRVFLDRLHHATLRGPATCLMTRVTTGATHCFESLEHEVAVARAWVDEARSDGGGVIAEAMRTRRAAAACSDVHSGMPPRIASDSSVVHTLVQYAEPQARLVICGAGDDAQPLAAFATMTDWSVTVVDRRARFATRERFPQSDGVEIVDGDWRDVRRLVDAQTFVVLLTHDLADDIAIGTALAAANRPAYIGVLGPPHRLDWLRDGLREAAVDGRVIASLRGPIGLDLGGRSPEQIALAIVAELTAHRFDRDARPLADAATVGAARALASVAP